MDPKIMIALRSVAKRLSMNGRISLAQSLLRRCFRHARADTRITDFDGDMVISLRLSEHMQRRIFWMDYYNRDIVAVLRNILRPGMVLIDAGANIGEITLVAAKLVGTSGQVVAFEPMADIAASLERNIADNHLDHVVLARLGLADAISSAPIYASCGQGQSDEENHGLGSLYGGDSPANSPVQNIQLTTLDAYLQEHPVSRLDVIKIDIEGAELPCLKGAARTLQRHRPILIIEIQEQTSMVAGYHQEDILDYLESFGYAFHTIGQHGKLTPIDKGSLASYQNVLCTPATHH
jgi:FkbM family methyltransferase